MATLKQVIDHVVAMDDPATARPSAITGAVRETIAALGLAVNEKTGEVYNPADSVRIVPRNDHGWYVRGVKRR